MEKIEIERFKINFENDNIINVDYYKKNMGNYKAHVFFCGFKRKEDLKKYWKNIANEIAIEYQSQIVSEIERANFYIGYFSAEIVSIELQNLIEQDPYCARKYVFDKPDQWLNQREILDNHIFGLKLSDLKSKDSRSKISKVCLQNFRGDADKAVFDLTDSTGKPASFVLIYAPNGVGKTSFMEGLEFALKGEVARLINLEKQAKHKGPTYHHYDRVDQKAYVQLFAKDSSMNEKVYKPRVVPEIVDGSDTSIDNRSYKGVFKCNQKDWDMVILPHDKIDSFITANSPERRYETWTKNDKRINNVAENLNKMRKTLRDNKRKYEAASEEKKTQEELMKSLNLKRDGLKQVITMVSEYNSLTDMKKDKLPDINFDTDIQSFLNLLTEARALSEECQNELEELEVIKAQISEWEKEGYEQCDLKYERFLDTLKEEQCVKKQQKLFIEREHINEELRNLDMELHALEKDRLPYINLETYGIKKIFEELTEYKAVETVIKLNENRVAEIDTETAKNQETINSIEENNKRLIILVKERENAIEKANSLVDYSRQINDIKNLLVRILKQKEKSISKKWEFDSSILNKQYIDEKQIDDLNQINNQLQLLDDKRAVTDANFSELLRQHQVQKTEIQDLRERAIQYLEKERNDCQCPVCHTKFESWDKLIFSIQNLESNEKTTYQMQLDHLNEEKNMLKKEYENKLKDIYKILENVNNSLREKEKSSNEILAIINEWFYTNGIKIDTNNNVIDYVKKYYISMKTEIKENQDKREKLIEKNRALKDEKIQLISEKKSNQTKTLELDASKLILLKEAENVETNYRSGKWNSLVKEIEDCKKKKDRVFNLLKCFDEEHTDIILLSKKLLNDKVSTIKKWIEENTLFAERYAPYFHQAKTLSEKKLDVEQKESMNTERLSRLIRIANEEGVKEYLKLWDDTKRKFDMKQQEEIDAKEQYERTREDYKNLADTLKIQLKEYFSQENANIIYQKIDPNNDLTDMNFSLTFTDESRPQLNYEMSRKNQQEKGYTAEIYLSTAQLNAVAFSAFFARALTESQVDLHSIMIDDPIGSFDDMNILGFTDLIRSIIMHTDVQIIMTTHDSKIFDIMQRKLNPQYHSARYYRLPEDLVTVGVDN